MRLNNEILKIAQIKTPSKWLDILNIELERNGITHKNDISCFLAQCSYESNGFSRLVENMKYSTAGLLRVFKGRNGLNDAIASKLVKEGEDAIADFVYGGEFGVKKLGNTGKNDGSCFKGRGIIQLTGRYNYTYYGKLTKLNIVDSPEDASIPVNAVKLAIAYWIDKKCQKHAILGECDKVSTLITGSKNDNGSFRERREIYNAILKYL